MLLIGGFQKLSLIDYPGKVAAVVFTQGCNFRCPFCHNRELVIPSEYGKLIPPEEIIRFLKERQGKLQGLVVTGGEPTIHPDLILFLQNIKALGYAIKLDTNGSRPDVLKEILSNKLVDFIALDIKAPLAKYSQIAGVEVDAGKIQESIQLVKDCGVEYLFRTTVAKPFFSMEDLEEISRLIQDARPYTIQEFTARKNVLDQRLLDKGHYSEVEIQELKSRWERSRLR